MWMRCLHLDEIHPSTREFNTPFDHGRFGYLKNSKKKESTAPFPSLQLGLVRPWALRFDFRRELHPSVASSNRHLQAVPFTLKAQQQHLSLDFGFDFIHSCAIRSPSKSGRMDGRTDGRGHLQVHRRPPRLSLVGLDSFNVLISA